MKREAINHTKMKRLCRKLDVPLFQGVGLLELLWHTTARQTPRGNIGRLPDDEIALALDYRGDDTVLIEALVWSKWLDRSDEYRLIVHDWFDHAEDGVHMKLARAKQYFVRTLGSSVRTELLPPKLSRFSRREREELHKFYFCAHENLFRAHGEHTNGVVSAHCLDLDPALTTIKPNSTGNLKDPSEQQHHRQKSDDVAAWPFAQKICDLTGLQKLSRADLKFCRELEAAGTSVEIIRAAVVIGKARRMIHESATGNPDRIRSLRYFAELIEESKGGLFDPGYVTHTEQWIERQEKAHAAT
jgi:hypothetical protein